jgi:hypothetical protein
MTLGQLTVNAKAMSRKYDPKALAPASSQPRAELLAQKRGVHGFHGQFSLGKINYD